MSIDLNVYMPSFNPAIVQQVTDRFRDFGMECEPHPEVVLNSEHGGFFPFKIRLISEGPESCRNKDYITGFEYAFVEFDYLVELEKLRRSSKKNLFQKLGFQKTLPLAEFLADAEIDFKLKNCKNFLEISFHQESELLMSWTFGAILSELTNGIFHDQQSGEYLSPSAALAEIPNLIFEPTDGWRNFDGWR